MMKNSFCILTLIFMLLGSVVSLAQEEQAAPPAQQEDGYGGAQWDTTVSDVKTVGLLGAAGAVIGLSTLSFVDEPTEHFRNILIGGAIGLIVGVIWIGWKTASNQRDYYYNSTKILEEHQNLKFSGLTTRMRKKWHDKNFTSLSGPAFSAFGFSQTF